MKTITAVIIGLSLVPLAYGKDVVEGSGKSVVVNRTLEGYDQIDLAVVGELYVTIGQQTPLAITADDNIAPLVKTEVKDGKLRIWTDKPFTSKTGIVLRVTVPNLKGLSIRGAANAHVTGLDNAKFALSAQGSCDVRVTGKTGAFSLGAQGAADIHAFDLKAQNASVTLQGASDVEVNAAKALNVTAVGASDVVYKGSPKVHSTVIGKATVQKVKA